MMTNDWFWDELQLFKLFYWKLFSQEKVVDHDFPSEHLAVFRGNVLEILLNFGQINFFKSSTAYFLLLNEFLPIEYNGAKETLLQ